MVLLINSASPPLPGNLCRKVEEPLHSGRSTDGCRWLADKNLKDRNPSCFNRRSLIAGLGASVGGGLLNRADALPAPFCGAVDVVPSWAFSLLWQEKVIDFNGFSTWVRVVGKGSEGGGLFSFLNKGSVKRPRKLPLLCIHGGPGLPSRYLETLELLAGRERQVVFYDQIGCGNSLKASGQRAPALADISLDQFVSELAAVREALGLEQCHMLGHGWGGQLALQAVVSGGATGVASLTLSSTAPSQARIVADRQQRLKELPENERVNVINVESDTAALIGSVYGRSYLTRRPRAGCLTVAEAGVSAAVSQALAGGKYFESAGILRDWSVEGLLHRVTMPTLVTRGDSDEILEGTAAATAAAIPSAELVTFQGAGSFTHIDACESYLQVVDAFLEKHDI